VSGIRSGAACALVFLRFTELKDGASRRRPRFVREALGFEATPVCDRQPLY
jgi:hypothetical protein